MALKFKFNFKIGINMKKIFVLLSATISLLLISCTTPLSHEGTLIRIVTENDPEKYEFLGTVSSFNTTGATTGHESENAINGEETRLLS